MENVSGQSFNSASGEITETQHAGHVPVLIQKLEMAGEAQELTTPTYSTTTQAVIHNEKGEIQQCVYVTYNQQGTIQSIKEHPEGSMGGAVAIMSYPPAETQDHVGMPGMSETNQLQLQAATGLPAAQESVQGLPVYLEEGMLPSMLLPEAADKLKVLADCCEDTVASSVAKPETQTLAQQQEAAALQQATTLRELGLGAYKNLLQLAMESSSVTPPPMVVMTNEREKKKLRAAQRNPADPAAPSDFSIFSNVRATLSGALLDAIPGSKAVQLRQIQEECDVSLEHDQIHNAFVINTDVSHLVRVENCFNTLLRRPLTDHAALKNSSKSRKAQQSTSDRAIMCDLLKPQYSRSGRELKPKTLDLPDDYYILDPEYKARSKSKSRLIKKKKGPQGRKPKSSETSTVSPETSPYTEQKSVEDIGYIVDAVPVSAEVLMDDINSVAQSGVTSETDPQEINVIIEKRGAEFLELPLNQAEVVVETAEELTMLPVVTANEDDGNDDNSEPNGESIECEKENTEGEENKTVQIGRKKPKKDYEKLAPFKYFCPLCSFKSKRHSHIRNHLKIHEKNLPLLHCSKCSFTTIRLSHLRRHEMTHADSVEVYSCPKCKYKTANPKLLSRHLRIKHHEEAHDKDSLPVLSCKHCDYKTTKPSLLTRHLKCHTDVNNDGLVSSYRCKLCPYTTSRREHFMRHFANVHTGQRPYMCEVCGKSFKRTDALRQHRLVHVDQSSRNYQFECSYCQKTFRSKAHLKDHLVKHSTQRHYLCELCGASFKTRSVQRKHILSIHKNPRAHSCDRCEKKFNTKYALLRHARTHSMVTPGMRALQVQQAIAQNGTDIVQGIPVVALPTNSSEGANMTSETIAAAATIEETLDQSVEVTLKQLPAGLLQADGTTLLYLANF